MKMRCQPVERNRLTDAVNAHHFPVLGVGRNVRQVHAAFHAVRIVTALALRRVFLAFDDVGSGTGSAEAVKNLVTDVLSRLGDVESELCPIFLRRAGRLIVHVEVDVRAGFDQLSGVALIFLAAAAGHEREQLLNFLGARSVVGARHLIA